MGEKDFAFDRVETMLREGLYKGNLHRCRRDAGRLAGGFLASGLLSLSDIAKFRQQVVDASDNPRQAGGTWDEAVEFGRKQPVSIEKRVTDNKPLTWDSEIGPGYTVTGVDYVEPLPEAGGKPVDDLVDYLTALYKPEDIVSYVTRAFEDGDGHFKPGGKGQYTRTAGELIEALRKHKDIETALESYNKEAGAWGRLNPMSGEGVRNDDVVDHRYVLVESDDIPVEQQLSTLRQIGLPCAAIVHSGGKSIHAVVRIDAGQDKALYRERVEYLFDLLDKVNFRVDRQNRNPSRLSRWPGFKRGDNTQYLISTNEGPATWSAFEASQKANKFKFDRWDPDYILEDHPDDSLGGDRFFVKHGAWLIVAQSGVGKSVIAMQLACCFATGRKFFDVKPVRPLKCVIVQAENNVIDLKEPLETMSAYMIDDDQELVRNNLVVLTVSRYAGNEFCDFLRYVIVCETPDVIIIDPLLAFSRGDISKLDNCNEFLRHQLDPILKENDIGIIAMHHTGKPPKDQATKIQSGDMSYIGIGSSDLTNWARAVSVIMEADNERYLFAHPKRGTKLPRQKLYIERGKDGKVMWSESHLQSDPEPPKKKQGKYDGLGFEFLAGVTTEELDRKIEHHFPDESLHKNKLGLEKRNFLSFHYQKKLWYGRAASDFDSDNDVDVDLVADPEAEPPLPF